MGNISFADQVNGCILEVRVLWVEMKASRGTWDKKKNCWEPLFLLFHCYVSVCLYFFHCCPVWILHPWTQSVITSLNKHSIYSTSCFITQRIPVLMSSMRKPLGILLCGCFITSGLVRKLYTFIFYNKWFYDDFLPIVSYGGSARPVDQSLKSVTDG